MLGELEPHLLSQRNTKARLRFLRPRILLILALTGIVAAGVPLLNPLEPRLNGQRDSQVVLAELYQPGGGPANGFTVLDVIGRERYVRALLTLYRSYRPSLYYRLRTTVRDEWFTRFPGRWPTLDRRIMLWGGAARDEPEVSDVRERIVTSLRFAGPAAAPAVAILMDRLRDHPTDVETVRALGAIGPAGSSSVSLLRGIAVRESDPWFLATLSQSLDRIEPGSRVVVLPAIIACLSSTNERVRAKSAAILGDFGSAAAPAVPDLERLRADPQSAVRTAADKALKSIQGVPAP